MAEAGDETEAADRLEAALERIAALAARPAAAAEVALVPPAALPEVTERLDALIAHLRQALDGSPGGPPPPG